MTFHPLPFNALSHNEELHQLIKNEIQKKSFISFARFMDLALYAPGLGYYDTELPKFGRQGDFLTAPEISSLFAKCLARQCQQILHEIKNGCILELGAGSGVLARDLLLELEKLNSLPAQYQIFEVSTHLRQRQQQLLKQSIPHLFSKLTWLDSLPTTPIKGIILANEVLDALPVHCFRIEDQSIKERCIAWENNQLCWKITEPTTSTLLKQIQHIENTCVLESGYESEINLMLSTWIKALSDSLKEGVILFFDYGYGQQEYYHPDRRQGTLMCYYQHHKHSNPLMLIGLQDITAHVNFTHVVESAIEAGLLFNGYTTQSAFLLACGLTHIAQAENLTNEVDLFKQNQAIKQLTLPSQMGEAIKVMALGKESDMPLIGFSLHERSRDL